MFLVDVRHLNLNQNGIIHHLVIKCWIFFVPISIILFPSYKILKMSFNWYGLFRQFFDDTTGTIYCQITEKRPINIYSLLQGQTMKMMYKIIAGALEEVGSDRHPRDYLNFYCLGKREACPEKTTSTANHRSETGSSVCFFFLSFFSISS